MIEIWGYLEAKAPRREADKGALINLVNVPEIQVFPIRQVPERRCIQVPFIFLQDLTISMAPINSLYHISLSIIPL